MHAFMEKDLGWKTLNARLSGNSVLYLMEEPGSKKRVMLLETKANGSCNLTLEGETRTVPNREDIGKALNLGKDATRLQQGSVMSQVIDELLRRHRHATHADVEDMMARFARGHL